MNKVLMKTDTEHIGWGEENSYLRSNTFIQCAVDPVNGDDETGEPSHTWGGGDLPYRTLSAAILKNPIIDLQIWPRNTSFDTPIIIDSAIRIANRSVAFGHSSPYYLRHTGGYIHLFNASFFISGTTIETPGNLFYCSGHCSIFLGGYYSLTMNVTNAEKVSIINTANGNNHLWQIGGGGSLIDLTCARLYLNSINGEMVSLVGSNGWVKPAILLKIWQGSKGANCYWCNDADTSLTQIGNTGTYFV